MSNSALTAEQRTVFALTTPRVQFTLRDEDGAVVPAASLTTLTMTLFDLKTRQYINNRSAVNALNANNVTVTSGGVVTYQMQAADNAIIGTQPDGTKQEHILQFRWTWSSGTKAGEHRIPLLVVVRDRVS